MKRYSAFRLHRDDRGHHAGIETLTQPEPATGEVLIRVSHSSVNYKDALAGTGRGKILRTFPLVGGIDAAGRVERSNHPDFQPGDTVIATGWGMSFDHDGGYAESLCVPGDWLVPLPDGLDAASAMILGTAGITAALAVHRTDQRSASGTGADSGRWGQRWSRFDGHRPLRPTRLRGRRHVGQTRAS